MRLGGVRGGDESAARDCAADPPADTWLDIAEDWTSGCRRRALNRLDAELQK
jgi:hypothetical protein